MIQGNAMPLPNGKAIMCAYKLCRVEFKYWGMQAKIERFIHDIGEFEQQQRHFFASLFSFFGWH